MKLPFYVLSLASLALLPSPVFAAESSAQRAGRAVIVAAYKKQDQALVKKDLRGITVSMAPDYRMKIAGQTLTRAQTEAMMRQTFSGAVRGIPLSYSRCTTRLLSLTWRGRQAIANVESTAIGQMQQSGRAAMGVRQISLVRDTWILAPGGWKVRESVETSGKMWLDGKRIR